MQPTNKLASLPETHANEVRQPCDWCGQSIPHEHPPGQVLLQIGALGVLRHYEARNWRICEDCVDLLIELVKFRTTGTPTKLPEATTNKDGC
jgi:hypothetical protein